MARRAVFVSLSMLVVACGARTGGLVDEGVATSPPVTDSASSDALGIDASAGCPPTEPVTGSSCTLDVMSVCNWPNGCGAFDTGWCEGGRWSIVSPGCVAPADAGTSSDAASCSTGAPCSAGETCRLGCFRDCVCVSGAFACTEYPC